MQTDLSKLQAAALMYESSPEMWHSSTWRESVRNLADYAMRTLPKAIESAPKDRFVLVYDPWVSTWNTASWDGKDWVLSNVNLAISPTHWAELPPVAEVSP